MTNPSYNRNQRVSKWDSKPPRRDYYELQAQIADLEANDNLRDYLRAYIGLDETPQTKTHQSERVGESAPSDARALR